MGTIRFPHLFQTLSAALVAGLLGCGSESGPTQPLVFAAVSAGSRHTCGVTTAGATYCWGLNDNGQLGDGTTTQRLTPKLVVAPAGVSFAAVTAGSYHTCGVTAAGAAYCWGANDGGQLGDGTTMQRLKPVLVAAEVPPGLVVSFAAVTAGGGHTCGVTAAGDAYCWGANGSGQLGDGTMTQRLTPVFPVAVQPGVSFAVVSAGADYTCGARASSAAYCWGFNANGELGDGSGTGQLTPVPVTGPSSASFAAVTAGFTHTCGVTAVTSYTYCWGNNYYGQLGDGSGSTTNQLTPVLVAGGHFAAVTAGFVHTCGVTAAGAAYCWGANTSGQLGNGATTKQSSPVAVLGGLTFAAVTAGTDHTCGVTTAGAAYCWGANDSGQLGDGTMIDRLTPVPVVR